MRSIWVTQFGPRALASVNPGYFQLEKARLRATSKTMAKEGEVVINFKDLTLSDQKSHSTRNSDSIFLLASSPFFKNGKVRE